MFFVRIANGFNLSLKDFMSEGGHQPLLLNLFKDV